MRRKHERCDPQVGQALLSPALEVAVTHLSPDKVIPPFPSLLSQLAIHSIRYAIIPQCLKRPLPCNIMRLCWAFQNWSLSGSALPGSNYCDRPPSSFGNQTGQEDHIKGRRASCQHCQGLRRHPSSPPCIAFPRASQRKNLKLSFASK